MIILNGYCRIILQMSEESLEKIDAIENTTKKQVIEAIKTSKKEYELSKQKTTISIQNIKDNTSEIIEKIDSKIPAYVQLYSDLYKKYLHIVNNFCTTSYLTQKEFCEKMGVDDARFTVFNAYLESIKKMALLQIDITENMFQSYVSYRLTILDFYDQMANESISSFAKIFFMPNNFKK